MDLDTLWNFRDPAGSEQRFRAALADASGVDALVLRTQLARSLGLQRRFAEAAAELSTVDPGDNALVAVHLDLERGRVHRSSGDDPAAARSCFVRALERAEAAGLDYLAADAAHMLAISEPGEAQIPWAERALKIANGSDDPRAQKWAGSITHNLGWTMHDLGRYEEALRYFEQSLQLREKGGHEEPIAVGRWTVARVLRSLKRYDEALAIQRDLAATRSDDGFVAEELGELLLATGEQAAAAPHFATAYRLLSAHDWLVADEPDRLRRLAELGGVGDV